MIQLGDVRILNHVRHRSSFGALKEQSYILFIAQVMGQYRLLLFKVEPWNFTDKGSFYVYDEVPY